MHLFLEYLKRKPWSIIMLLMALGISAVLLLSSSALNLAQGTPPVHWTPDAVNATIARGGRTEVQVSLNAVETIGNVYLRIVPELAPYVDVSPATLNNVKAGDTVSVRIS